MSRQQGDQIQPIVFRDMTGGLWERGNEREVPQNGLIECQDCMPLPSGGLRAAWAWDEDPKPEPTGVPRRIAGYQVFQSGFNAFEVSAVTATTGGLPGSYEVWQGFGTSFSSNLASTWAVGTTHSWTGAMYPVKFEQFWSNSTAQWYYNIAESSNAEGVWRKPSLLSSATTRVFTTGVFYLLSHQQRLIYVTRRAGSIFQKNQLVFTEPSTDATPPTSNVLVIEAGAPADIHYMNAAFPTDLFLLKQGDGAYVIQGNIASGPLVRDSLVRRVPEQYSWGVRIPNGIAYMTQHDGVWLWSGGQDAVPLSLQIVGSPMVEATLGSTIANASRARFLGQVGYAGHWLFTPKGYVYDIDNRWWFKSSYPALDDGVIYPFWSIAPFRGRIYAAGSLAAGGNLRIIQASYDESAMARASKFSATLPILDTQERSIQVRYIEVFGQGFGNGGTWQLELTNSKGETELTPLKAVPARAASARFDTKLQGDWLKIRVLSQGNPDAAQSVTQASEAPMIDRIVVWARPKTRRI